MARWFEIGGDTGGVHEHPGPCGVQQCLSGTFQAVHERRRTCGTFEEQELAVARALCLRGGRLSARIAPSEGEIEQCNVWRISCGITPGSGRTR